MTAAEAKNKGAQTEQKHVRARPVLFRPDVQRHPERPGLVRAALVLQFNTSTGVQLHSVRLVATTIAIVDALVYLALVLWVRVPS